MEALAVPILETSTIDLNDYAEDPEDRPLTFSTVSAPDWLTLSDAGIVRASPGIADYHNGVGRLDISVSDGTHHVAMTIRFDPTTEARWSTTYAWPRLQAGHRTELRIGLMDEPEVWVDGQQVTDNALLEYEAVWCAGRPLQAAVEYSNTETGLYRDGVLLTTAGGFSLGLRCIEDTAMWTQIRRRTQDAVLECLPAGSEMPACGRQLDYVPRYVAATSNLHVLGRELSSGKYRFETYARDGALVQSRELDEPRLLIETAFGPRLVEIAGEPSLQALFWALEKLHGPQLGEPFAGGNDFLGRLGSNQSHRIAALVQLLTQWPDPVVHGYLVAAVSRLLSNADDNGLFFSTKYSLSRQTEIAFGIDVMTLYQAVLSAHDSLGPSLGARAVELARRAFLYYERDWVNGRYLLPSCTDMRFDGIVAPMNFQSRWGAVALQLYSLTGEERFLERATALYEYVAAQTEPLGSTRAWHYWPLEFYAGWDASKYVSCNLPTSPPTKDSYFDDYSHALATIEFIEAYEHEAGRAPLVDFESLAEMLYSDGNRFFFSLGRIPGEAAERYLPYGYWARASRVARHFHSLVVTPSPDYDSQSVLQAHAWAAGRDPLRPGDSLRILTSAVLADGSTSPVQDSELVVTSDACTLDGRSTANSAGGCLTLLRQWFEKFMPAKPLYSEPYSSTRGSAVGG